MTKPVHVLIVGGGISGLTLANLLIHGQKKVKFHVTLFESRPFCDSQEQSIGGGIGLWPPSQSVLKNLPNYQAFIQQYQHLMPFPSYRDANGAILARAKDDFAERFPVQCLNRDDLINMLASGLKNRDEVEIITAQKISSYERDKDQVLIHTANKSYQGDLLIAADGIHSKIRNQLMAELKRPPVHATELGYTYFRANTTLPVDSPNKWWAVAFETWGASSSQQNDSCPIRFGYVPLKPPHAFWFIAVKTQKDHPYFAPVNGVQIVNEDTKAFLKGLIRDWKPVRTDAGELAVNYEALIDATTQILRTDIAKIAGLAQFPWTSVDKRIVLMGDAAHATAPNIAQGAGLCIEDAACLASRLNRVDYLEGIAEYEQERKPRAQTVQNIADLIAFSGQIQHPLLQTFRNAMMHAVSSFFPSLQRSVFDYCVSYSLGGSRRGRYWQPPPLSIQDDASTSLFATVVPEFERLDNHVKEFKTSTSGGSGLGVVTVEKPGSLAKVIGFFSGFPREMVQQPFQAAVVNVSGVVQRWSRVFGYNTSQQKTYATTHSLYRDFNQQVYLSEGIGGYLDKAFRFVYQIKRQPDNSLKYESRGMTFLDAFKIPLPSFLLPKSEWIEKPTEQGWNFDGKISLPLVGTLLHYYGHFQLDKKEMAKNKRLITAGGSGMIGKEVCLEFIKKGYDVYCLSRSAGTEMAIAGVKVRCIDEDWSELIDKNTVILNLSGANPGASRWTSSVKSEIAASRFRIIDLIIQNIERAREKPLKYLQASAAGFYGNAGDTLLTEDSEPVAGKDPGTQFRINVCQEIEARVNKAHCNVVKLRLGHVLSNAGGLLPHYRLAGFLGAGRFASGNQFVPFVHIKDVARAIEFIANNDALIDGAINIAAPKPCSNSEMLRELRLIKWLPGVPLPEAVLKLLIGESSVVLTDSERVEPKRLLESGFEFDYNTLSESLHGLQ